ncbi:ral guanine nucleotide dissociation stimulator-like isoform 3-T3 [Thomomys bottae]
MIGCARCEASKYVLNTRTFAGQRTVGRKNQNGEFDLIRRQWLIPWPGCLRRNPRYIPQYGDILAPSLADPCKAGYMRGGKVKQLVEHLVPALLFGDASFIPVFLGTYRTFTTTQHILTLLFNRYSSFQQLEGEKAGAKGQLQQAFAFILGSWMREYPEDFLEAPDSSCLQQLVAYLHLNMPGSIEEHQACLLLTHLELRNPKEPELEGALAAISEPGGPNPLEPSTLEPGNDEEVPVSTPETQLPQGKAEANPSSAPTPAAGADQAEAPMSTVAETCVAACLLAGEVACLPPAVEEPEPTAQEPVPPIEEEAPGPSVPQAACLPTAYEEPEPSAQEPVPPIEEEAPGPSVPQAACLPTANEEPEPSAQEPVPPIEEEAPGPSVPQVACLPTANEKPEPSAQEPVPPIEEEAPWPSVPQAACLPTANEEPEPSAQEPVPPIEEEAPGPSSPLRKDAEGFREVVYPLPGNDQGHGLSISEDTRATLLSAAELEPDSVPLAREAHMGTETDPAPWESLTVGDFQISSRGPSRISLLKLEEMSTAHLVEWLPDQKAEQFTIMAVRLFKELKPYECLSYVYFDPDKKRQELLAPTVLAILHFYNQIETSVITTSVLHHSAEAADRAEVLEHWIEVALESHHLKNAISVCAILSALQSSALQGLKQTWRAVSRGSLEVWQELRKIYSMEKHYKVGPQSTRMAFWSKLKRGLGTQKELDYSEGTVPYLGTILNHLASLHHHKDKDSKNGKWIHMQRRREEYKVLALIKELQGACQELHVVPEEKFVKWFTNLKRLSPSECDKLCQELEPPRWASFLHRKSRKSKKSLVQRKPSKDHQTSSKTFSSHSSSQLNTSEEVSIRSISHETSGHLGFSTRPSILYRRGYHSTPNISNSKIDFQYEGILGFLSPQPSRRTGHEGIY